MEGHRNAFNKAFFEAGLPWIWDPMSYKNLLSITGGKSRIRFYAQQRRINLDLDFIEFIHKRKQFFYKEIVTSGEINLRVGVKRLLLELQSMSVQQWIVTASTRNSVQILLDNTFKDLDFLFDGWITGDDVLRHKPDPQGYLNALEASGISSKETIVIEDSLPGLRSARDANISCLITLPTWYSKVSDEYKNASAVINHLGEGDKASVVLDGPKCSKGFVDFDYLNLILEQDSF